MQRFGLWLSLLAMAATPVWAQVAVEVRLDQDQFLPGESLVAAVRITNRSGQAITLGREADWLVFNVESLEGGVVSKLGDPPVEGEFVLESSKVATKRVDLAPYFLAEKPGRFSVTATIKIVQWGSERSSAPKSFDIIEGRKLWQQEVGLPKPPGAPNDAPEVRRYLLQQANYTRGQIRLYVRVTDESGMKTLRVLPVGKMLSFSRPEPQVDAFSNLHLIYQSGPQLFSYTKYSPDGELLLRQTYEYTDTRPRLYVDAEREIGVKGGARRTMPTDIPTPVLDNASTNSSPAAAEALPAPGKQ